jgi:hypothetical protein
MLTLLTACGITASYERGDLSREPRGLTISPFAIEILLDSFLGAFHLGKRPVFFGRGAKPPRSTGHGEHNTGLRPFAVNVRSRGQPDESCGDQYQNVDAIVKEVEEGLPLLRKSPFQMGDSRLTLARAGRSSAALSA